MYTPLDRGRGAGFTLIELLVVVAIIALLISILLPSLGQARGQARTSLCASRVSQLTKAMLLYADDYSEPPPFVGVGHRQLGESDDTYPTLDGQTEWTLGKQEKWLTNNLLPETGDLFRITLCTNWDTLGGADVQRVETGTIYSYTRFPSIYRCPEFERVPVGSPGRNESPKSQNVFNYTRSVMGRKMLSNLPYVNEPGARDELEPGPIMKVSAIYSPSAMFLMLDEQWDFHCAGNYKDGGIQNLNMSWQGADTIHGLVFDGMASSHGVKSNAINLPGHETLDSARGSMGCYDGHVELYQDPLPYRSTSDGGNLVALFWKYYNTHRDQMMKVADPLLSQAYAQRGIGFTDLEIAELITRLFQ
jgi:prepilin-type N-terminal cleavage/methylation domain-containing protein